MTVRTRFAPSPTGELHLGNARIAVLNWLYAQHCAGTFILRIEDTDLDRNVAGSETELLAALRDLGLDWGEGPGVEGQYGPYRQSERLDIYHRQANELMATGQAFRCYCTAEEVAARQEAARSRGGRARHDPCRGLASNAEATSRREGITPSIRFAVPDESVVVNDRVRGAVEFTADEFEDFVILKSDGTPSYNFAVVVDDIGMQISHVIRGAGHLSNTPRQLMIYRALDATPPEFVHVPHVLAPDGSPLSKRHGARSLSDYLDRGYHPDALVNYLSLLSWSSPTGDEVLPRRRLIEEIDLSRLGASDVRLDPDKLEWLSGEHIRLMDPAELGERLAAYVDVLADREPAERKRVAAALQPRLTTFGGAERFASQLYPPDPMSWDRDALAALGGEGAARVLRAVRDRLARLSDWNGEAALQAVREAGKEVGARGRALFMPVRAALTGATQGPELVDVLEIQGGGTTLRVLEQALRRIEAERTGE